MSVWAVGGVLLQEDLCVDHFVHERALEVKQRAELEQFFGEPDGDV